MIIKSSMTQIGWGFVPFCLPNPFTHTHRDKLVGFFPELPVSLSFFSPVCCTHTRDVETHESKKKNMTSTFAHTHTHTPVSSSCFIYGKFKFKLRNIVWKKEIIKMAFDKN